MSLSVASLLHYNIVSIRRFENKLPAKVHCSIGLPAEIPETFLYDWQDIPLSKQNLVLGTKFRFIFSSRIFNVINPEGQLKIKKNFFDKHD
jgi:hypothetical protein